MTKKKPPENITKNWEPDDIIRDEYQSRKKLPNLNPSKKKNKPKEHKSKPENDLLNCLIRSSLAQKNENDKINPKILQNLDNVVDIFYTQYNHNSKISSINGNWKIYEIKNDMIHEYTGLPKLLGIYYKNPSSNYFTRSSKKKETPPRPYSILASDSLAKDVLVAAVKYFSEKIFQDKNKIISEFQFSKGKFIKIGWALSIIFHYPHYLGNIEIGDVVLEKISSAYEQHNKKKKYN